MYIMLIDIIVMGSIVKIDFLYCSYWWQAAQLQGVVVATNYAWTNNDRNE
jgi:hypothetical protein